MDSSLATVVIPNYNGRRFLPMLMESLAAQVERRFTITLVDDASTDDSVAYIQHAWPNVKVIRNPRNLGFAASCNVALKAVQRPFVILLNNDTHVEPGWLAEGLKPFEDAAVGAVASLVLLDDPPHLVDTAGDVYSVAGGAVKRHHGLKREGVGRLPREIFSPSGVSAFYRREALASAGYLDERFESYYEDVDLGFRLARLGYDAVFAPASVCYHRLSSSYDPGGWRYHFNSARNAEVVWWANLPLGLMLRFLAAHLCFNALQAAHKIIQGRGIAYLCGKLAVLAHLGHILAKRRDNSRLTRRRSADLAARLERRWWSLHVSSRANFKSVRGSVRD